MTGGNDVPGFDAGRGRDATQGGSGGGGADAPEGLPLFTGPQIRAERMRQGWKQVHFAQALGCSRKQLQDIENPARPPEPQHSSFYPRIVEILKLDQPRERASAVNPNDPPLSQASKLQLARALYRIVSDEEAARRLSGEVEDFDVEGTDLIDEPRRDGPRGRTSGLVNRTGDGDPPPGTVQS